jgi:hypothetical protein
MGGGGSMECSEPFLDCDDSPITRCETDIRRDTAHCGGCGQSCDGACSNGRCVEFERIAEDGLIHAGLAVSTDHVYFLASASSGQTALRRFAKQGGTVETVLHNLSLKSDSFTGVAVGIDRVYVVDGETLKSTPLASPGLADEAVDTRVPPIVNGGNLYAWTTDGALLRRSLSFMSSDELVVPWSLEDLYVSWQAELAAFHDEAVVGTTIRSGTEPNWEIRHVNWPNTTSIAVGPGVLMRVRTVTGSDLQVVWLVDRSESGEPNELHALTGIDGVRKIATERAFTDFCLSSDLVYASFERLGHGLRVLSMYAPNHAEVFLRANPVSLLCDDDHVYFYDWADDDSPLLRVNAADLSP